MDIKTAIAQRRSIRKYQDKEVPNDLIEEIIDAARLAPSGKNSQPWRFYIVKDRKIKNEFKANKIFTRDFVYNSPAFIICCADPNVYQHHPEEFDNQNDIRANRDLAIASAFLILRATELGLGTCYIGSVNRDKIKNILNIPSSYLVPYVITVGYPNENPQPTPRKKLEEIVLLS
ncbi:MAG: nitroreductase family protein [Candidatus Magasanikbacteria bacterium]